jgi:hypothetical protein
VAACGGGGGFPDAPPNNVDATEPGTFSLDWTVVDSDNMPLACERIDGQAMTVIPRNIAIDGGNTQIFTCGSGSGTSQAILAGTYSIDFELTSPMFGLLATAPQQNQVVVRSGQDTHLEPVTFQVDATGGLALNLSAGAGGNCAVMDTVSIALTHASDGACEPLVLDVGAGATSGKPASTYTINCAAPLDVPCIENDQTITAMGVTSDQYTIRLRGKKTGVTSACWTNDDSLRVPPLGMTLTRTLNFAATNASGC